MKMGRKNKDIERELPSFLKAGPNWFKGRLVSIANFLQHKTNNYSLGKKKLLLFLFVIMFVTESSVVIIQRINQKGKMPIAITRIQPILVESNKSTAPLITKGEFLKIQRFRNYIDSLNTTAQGRKIRDSLLNNRPHLMDSVNFLINLFLEQSKTIVK